MQLYYKKIGNGSKILLAFHGVGQDFSCFMPLAEAFIQDYTTYLFDLPFHGKSQIKSVNSCTVEAWLQFFNDFLTKNQIQRFSLIGFSIGAKMVLTSYRYYAARIDKVLLLAPDGIVVHPLYRLATQTIVGQKLFQWVLANPVFIINISQGLRRIGLLPTSSAILVTKLLSIPQKRQLIYAIWLGMSHFSISVQQIIALSKQYHTTFYCFVGDKDDIIPAKRIQKLTHHLPTEATIVLAAAHHHLVEKTLYYLQQHPSVLKS